MKYLYKISLVMVILFSGCKASLKREYGIKEPKLENKTTINEFLISKKIDNSNIYIFKNLMAYAQASNKKILNIPDAIFFNKYGHFVSYKKTAKDCNAKIDDFLTDLEGFSKLPSDPTQKMDELLTLVTNGMNSNPVKNEITVFITWAVFAGKLNDEKAFNWLKLLEEAKSKGIKVSYYLLNCDIQESWNLSEEELKSLGIVK